MRIAGWVIVVVALAVAIYLAVEGLFLFDDFPVFAFIYVGLDLVLLGLGVATLRAAGKTSAIAAWSLGLGAGLIMALLLYSPVTSVTVSHMVQTTFREGGGTAVMMGTQDALRSIDDSDNRP